MNKLQTCQGISDRMLKWTVLYIESWLVGSHRQTLPCVAHVEGETLWEALNEKGIDTSAVFAVYDGHLQQSKTASCK